MRSIMIMSLCLLLLPWVTACKSDIKHQLKQYNIETSTEDEEDTIAASQPVDSMVQQGSNSVVYGSGHSSSSHYDKGSQVDYAEKKTTDELEDEYYNVFGEDALDHIDDEEYDAAELYEQEYDD